ncbi:DUF6153 family protein [Streptomyces sp. KR80]|uniref:DUF6153 family protein n=1 Tax=Streptomyces sp. KR80 TaxID=3457426 RepID=UPI003FD3FDDF
MRTKRNTRAAGAWGHLLLMLVLAFSVFAMHTLGHPDDQSGAHAGALSAHSAAAEPKAMGPDHSTETGDAHSFVLTMEEREHGAASLNTQVPSDGMDSMSVCLAVLSSLLLAVLLRLALARERLGWTNLTAAVLASLRPEAPPPRGPSGPSLAQLSVLRI